MGYHGCSGGAALEKNDVLDELENILGAEAANRFVDYYCGSSVYIPRNIIITREHRKIRKEFRDGAGYRELALRYGYSERHIRTIIHEKGKKR